MNSNSGKTKDCVACDFQDQLDILRQISFFSQLPLETNKVLAYLCTQEVFKQGDTIFSQGDTDGQAIYILKGEAAITHSDGIEKMKVREVGAETFLGGLSLLADMPWLFSLEAISDIHCLVMTRDKFSKALEQNPTLMALIMKGMVISIRRWEKRLLADHAKVCRECIEKAGVSLL